MKARFKKPIRRPYQPKVHVLTGISVGTSSQTGERFSLFANLINEHQADIAQLTILLTGELHGYQVSVEQQVPLSQAIKLAKQFDIEWLTINEPYLTMIQVPVNIIHWHELNVKAAFKKSFAQTLKEYKNNPIFKKIVDEIVCQFSTKLYESIDKKNANVNYDDCLNNNLLYCLEEVAIYPVLMELGADLQVYPGKNNAAMQYIYDKRSPEDPFPWIEYRFDK